VPGAPRTGGGVVAPVDARRNAGRVSGVAVQDSSRPQTPPLPSLTGAEKAALLLWAVGEEASGAVLRHMSSTEVRELAACMARLEGAPTAWADAILNDFINLARDLGEESPPAGESDLLRRTLASALGDDVAARVMAEIGSGPGPFATLEGADAVAIAELLEHEHPQTVALSLAHMEPSLASRVLPFLPEELAAHAVLRLADLKPVAAEMRTLLGEVLGEQLVSWRESHGAAAGGGRCAARMLGGMDRDAADDLLDRVAQSGPTVADRIRQHRFEFEDLARLEDRSLQELLRAVSREILGLALTGTATGVRERFFANLSERAAAVLREEMERCIAARPGAVQAARGEVLQAAWRLAAQGRIHVEALGPSKGGGQ